jgi:hypothetical protein
VLETAARLLKRGRKPSSVVKSNPTIQVRRDKLIASALKKWERKPPRSWGGSTAVHRSAAPAYFQYPAMMSPVVQRDVLNLIRTAYPAAATIIDPFCGSGTVLTEAMYSGLECWSADINPLAVLICQVKAGRFDIEELKRAKARLTKRVEADGSRAMSTDLRNWRKWFREKAALQLSQIRRAIRKLRSIEVRRFFWVCLAETVRLTSNSRTSTYKLHIRTKAGIEKAPWPNEVFERVLGENIEKHKEVSERLDNLGYLNNGQRYFKKTPILRRNVIEGFSRSFDILMTSPPYGDNSSTVPYGQSSYLPLHWIDLKDVDSKCDATLLRNTHALDHSSLGGSRPRNSKDEVFTKLRSKSKSLDRLLTKYKDMPPDRTSRVLGFFRDLDLAIPKLVRAVKVDGYFVWTVGNRTVGRHKVPLAEVLTDLLTERTAVFVGSCTRRIPHKRMASRNATSRTMRKEQLLVFRRVAAKRVR